MKNCKKCKQQFQETKDKQFFCSHTCQAKWAITLANISKMPKPKTGITLNCMICKSKFYVPHYRAKTAKYCNRSCLAKDKLSQYIPIHGFKRTGKPRHKYKVINIEGRQIREHRWIMEQYLGRKLEKWEHVHHKNDDPSDNRIENLEVLSNSDHQRKEYKFRKNLTSFSS